MIESKPIGECTVEDFNDRFASGSWGSAGGNLQSVGFTFAAVTTLEREGFLPNIYEPGVTLHDYGCAEGDGTAALAALLPGLFTTGIDISSEAVQRARSHWPTLKFSVGDIQSPQTHAHIIWTSHTLEHVPDPARVVGVLRQHCKWLVVLVPPVPGDEETGPHVGSVPFEQWVGQVTIGPSFRFDFDTTRQVSIHDKLLVVREPSRLVIWKGGRV